MHDESSEPAPDVEAPEVETPGAARAQPGVPLARGVDRSFQEYCRTADPRALARVFDEVATDLLFVADQLVGCPVLAEDLVQETFLLAVERASSWDAARGVEAWLIDILRQTARRVREDRSRILDKDRVPKERVLDPDAGLQQRELMRELRRALLQIKERNRDVLRLYLLHGMTLSEVAEALGRSREAVKAQHRRGMKHLRRLLPAGLSIGSVLAAVAVTAPRGLAHVRREVLKRAGELAPAVTSASATMGTVVLIGLAIIACAIYPFRTIDRDAPVTSTVLAAPVDPGSVAATEAAPELSLRRVADRAVPTTSGTATASIEVRIRRENDGEPVPSVGVRVVARDRHKLYRCMSATTDRRGRCSFERVRPGEYWAVTTQGHSSRVQVEARSVARLALTTTPGVTVRARVVDPRGAPVVGGRVRVGHLPDLLELHVGAGETDRDGRFELRDLRPGSFFAVVAPGFHSGRIHWCTQDVGTVQHERIEMLPTQRLRGIVVRGDGQPAGFARLLFGKHATQPRGIAQLPTSATADEVGRFDFEVPRAGTARWLWVCAYDAPALALRLDTAGLSRETLRLELPLAARVRGVVRDRSGRTVAGAAVRVFPEEITQTPEFEKQVPLWARRDAVSDAEGRFDLGAVGPGRVVVRAEHAARGTARASLVTAVGAVSRWDPVLRAHGTIAGQVVDRSGRALVGWQAALSSPGKPTMTTMTDARGCFRFEDRDDRDHRLALRPLVPHVLAYPAVEFDVRTNSPARRYRVDALPDCSLRAILPDAAVSLWPPALDVILEERSSGCTIRLNAVTTTRVLELEGLLAGRFELRIRSRGRDLAVVHDVELHPHATVDLGLLPMIAHGRLVGTVRDASSATPLTGAILLSDTAQRSRTIAVRLGKIDETSLPVGEYDALFVMPDGRNAFERIVVRDGGSTRLALAVGYGQRVQFVGSAADTVVGRFSYRLIRLEGTGSSEVLALASRSILSAGQRRQLLLPVGRYRLIVREERSEVQHTCVFEVSRGTTTVRIPSFEER